jgi:hypothetical protein
MVIVGIIALALVISLVVGVMVGCIHGDMLSGLFAAYFVIAVSMIGGIVYVAVHFIAKYW